LTPNTLSDLNSK
nr:RecName: Full=Putative glycosyltransferase [Taxus baccata]